MSRFISNEKLNKFYMGLKEKIKANYYSKLEVDDIVSNIDIDTSDLLDKNTYDSDNDGVIDKSKVADKIEGIESASVFSVYGKSPTGEEGFYEFPVDEVINDIEEATDEDINNILGGEW